MCASGHGIGCQAVHIVKPVGNKMAPTYLGFKVHFIYVVVG